jgi:peptide/nickel transport system permease protein
MPESEALQTKTTGDQSVPEEIMPGSDGSAEVPDSIAALSTRQLAWRRFKRHKPAMASGVVLVLLALATVFGPLVSTYNYHQLDLTHLMASPNMHHWFGTDNLGRDEFVRVLYGGRISLIVGLSVALSAGFLGAVIGSWAGYYGGWIDNLLMRVTDLFLAFPFLVLLIILSRILGTSILNIVMILTFVFWMADARIVRSVFLSMKQKEFVEAARASGASNKRIMFYHMLPNAMGPIVVNVTLGVAAAILTESALSFLGFGIQPPTPSWGNLLDEAQSSALTHPHLVWFPGLMILLTVLCVNFFGDGLRDALDPHGKISETV